MCKKLIYLLLLIVMLGLTSGPAKAETIWVEAENYDTLTGPLELFKPNLTASGLACLGTDEGRGDSNNDPPAADNGVATYNITVAGGTYKIMGRWKNAGSNSFWWRIATGTSAQITHASGAANCNNWPGSNYWEWADVRDDNTAGDPTVEWVLAAGDHVVEVMRREDGTWLDGFIVTDNLTLDRNTLPDLIIDPTRGTDPGPGDGARKASETVQLTWTAGTTAVGNHKVLFGTDPGSLAEIATPAVGTETADPGTLAYNTDHYWQIVENDGTSDLAGPIWTFRTTPDPAVMADADIIGQWMFEGDFTDSSGYEYNGAEAGSVSIISDPERGQVALFDNSDHPRVEIGDDQIFNPEGDFSISLWANIGSWTGNWANVMISKYGEDNLGWQLRRANSDLFSFTTRSGGDQDCRSDTVPPLNQWVHITVVYDTATSKKRIYFDGVLDIERNGHDRHVRTTHHIMWIGTRSNNRNNNHDRHFTGMLDDIRFYTKALTPAEITDLAVANIASNPDPANGENVSADVQDVTNNLYDILTFTPGKGAISHEAFFSDDIQDVIDRNPANSLGPPPYPGRQPDNGYYVGFVGPNVPAFAQVSLEREQTYYWTVDENDGATTWPGHIWSFTVMTVEAWDPSPYDGENIVTVDPAVDLSWQKGDIDETGVDLTYEVHLGTSFDDVNTSVTPLVTGLTSAAYSHGPLADETTYYWRVDMRLKDTSLPTPFDPDIVIQGVVWSFTSAPAGLGEILREYWLDMPDQSGNISALLNDARYPDNPDGSELLTSFDGPDGWDCTPPATSDNYYGSRIHGWLYVKLSGEYTFWHSSDDDGRLYLSPDEDPGKARVIAEEAGSSGHNAWQTGREQSMPVYLEGGRRYYISSIMREGTGGDNHSVAWQGPDQPLPPSGSTGVISGSKLKAYQPIFAGNPDPVHNAAVADQATVTLSWTAAQVIEDTNNAPASQDVYFGTNYDDVRNATTSDAEWQGNVLAGNPSEWGPLAVTAGTWYYWRIDAVGSVTEGPIWAFVALDSSVTDPDLIGWWKMDGDATDSSPFGHDGILIGGAGFGPGYFDQALVLDGNGDAIRIPYTPKLTAEVDGLNSEGNEYADMTVACWFYIDAWTANNQAFMSQRGEDDGDTGRGWVLRRDGGGQDINFRTRGPGSDDTQTNTNTPTGEWTHLAVTYAPEAGVVDNGIKRMYLNGVQVRTETDDYEQPDPSWRDLYIGAQGNGSNHNGEDWFEGMLDDVRLYNRALTAAEIGHIMDPAKAWNPDPADNEYYVALDKKLTWTAGTDADTELEYTKQDVYFGTDFDAVSTGTTPDATLIGGPSEYTPAAPLTFYQTCYWRVDGVNASDVANKGNVWTFTAIYDASLIIDANLVGWWKLDGDPTDSSGYGNDGIENGNPGYVSGYDGQAIDFDRVDDYIDCGNRPTLNMVNKLTVASWVRGPFTRDWESFVSKRGEGDGWKLRRQGGTDNACFTIRDTSGPDDPQGSININDGEWHHVVGTWDGATRSLYVDGQLDRADADTGTMTATTDENVIIGAWMAGPGDIRHFAGITLDDIRIYDYALSLAQVIEVMRINPAWAWGPKPTNGATGVGTEPTLSWNSGDYAPLTEGHYVYFGADDPANLDLVADQPQSPNNYSPGALDLDRTYYWAVDEANGAAGDVDAGKIWSFTTSDHLVVDDMEEDYVVWGNPGLYVCQVWVDGSGDCNAILGNGTGSLLGLETTISYPDGFEHSMEVEYDNDGIAYNFCTEVDETRLTYSMVKAEVANLPSGIASDWTAAGAEALVLQFYGSTGNAIEPMWVELTDGSGGKATASYGDYADEDPCDIDKTSWHQWNINLQDFADDGVTLSDVNSIAIGIGDPDATEPGGSGLIYFDDIRLYAPRCILSRRDADFAVVDYAPEGTGGDCVIDYKDLDVMSGDWIEFDYTTDPIAPDPCDLALWLKLENDVNDSSGNDRHGTAVGAPVYVAGQDGQAIDLDGAADAIHVNHGTIATDVYSMAMWLKCRDLASYTGGYRSVMHTNTWSAGSIHFHLRRNADPSYWLNFDWNNGFSATANGAEFKLVEGEWYHAVMVADRTVTPHEAKIYLDGVLAGENTGTAGALILAEFNIGAYQQNDRWFNGQFDDIRVYTSALSQAEVLAVGGLGPVYTPVTSPANVSDDEPINQKVVNFKDYAVLTDRWLEEQLWPRP